MKKTFCDCCKKEIDAPILKALAKSRGVGGAPIEIEVKVLSGPAGAPDICMECVVDAVARLAKEEQAAA